MIYIPNLKTYTQCNIKNLDIIHKCHMNITLKYLTFTEAFLVSKTDVIQLITVLCNGFLFHSCIHYMLQKQCCLWELSENLEVYLETSKLNCGENRWIENMHRIYKKVITVLPWLVLSDMYIKTTPCSGIQCYRVKN